MNEPLLLTPIIKICDYCNNHLRLNQKMIKLASNKRLCQSCIKQHTSCCASCSTRIINKEAIFMDSSPLCRPCKDVLTSVCLFCDRLQWKGGFGKIGMPYGKRIKYVTACSRCKNNFPVCNKCVRYFDPQLISFCEGHNKYFCSTHKHQEDCDGYNLDFISREAMWVFKKGKNSKILGNSRFMGVEIEAERKEDANDFLPIPKNFVEMSDASLTDGTEVATPPASGLEHYKNIKKLCNLFHNAEYEIKETCGLHVHIDMRDKKNDFKYLAHLFTTFFAIEDVLFAMQPESRQNNKYCQWLRDGYNFFSFYGKDYVRDFDFRYYKKDKVRLSRGELNRHVKNRKYTEGELADSHHYGINMHSIFYRGTLEIRMHAGSLNPVKITRWCNLLQHVVDWIDTKYDYKKVVKLLQMDVTEQKLLLMKKTFKLPQPLYKYVSVRIKQFQNMNTNHFYVLGETPKSYKTLNIQNDKGEYRRRIII